ncbi:MAG: hypothetical protein RBR50_04380 [Candidatus Izemoplasmatales bacterium]|nr:hypothetical protein [Candidatus Izemoplasmatales bacterium]
MSDNNGSILDSIIAGAILVYAFMALVILFPLMPGGVLGYELSKTLTSNTDIHKLSIIIGMVVNIFVYMMVIRLSSINIDLLSTKVYIYIFTIGFTIFLNSHTDNPLLQVVTKTTFEIIEFFLDFDRWFVENVFLNMALVVIYAFVTFWIIAKVIELLRYFFGLFEHSSILRD